jgi:hypothetical protein
MPIIGDLVEPTAVESRSFGPTLTLSTGWPGRLTKLVYNFLRANFMSRDTVRMTAAVFAIFATMTAPAYAYIDPGMGSLALQALVGAVAGGMFAARIWWARIVSFLPGGSRKKSSPTEAANAETPAE